MSTNGKRRTWSAAEKLRIVLAGMEPDVEVADLCRREGLNPVQFYAWKKQLLGSAARVFEDKRGRPDARETEARGRAPAAQERDRRDHRREPRSKKGLSG